MHVFFVFCIFVILHPFLSFYIFLFLYFCIFAGSLWYNTGNTPQSNSDAVRLGSKPKYFFLSFTLSFRTHCGCIPSQKYSFSLFHIAWWIHTTGVVWWFQWQSNQCRLKDSFQQWDLGFWKGYGSWSFHLSGEYLESVEVRMQAEWKCENFTDRLWGVSRRRHLKMSTWISHVGENMSLTFLCNVIWICFSVS